MQHFQISITTQADVGTHVDHDRQMLPKAADVFPDSLEQHLQGQAGSVSTDCRFRQGSRTVSAGWGLLIGEDDR